MRRIFQPNFHSYIKKFGTNTHAHTHIYSYIYIYTGYRYAISFFWSHLLPLPLARSFTQSSKIGVAIWLWCHSACKLECIMYRNSDSFMICNYITIKKRHHPTIIWPSCFLKELTPNIIENMVMAAAMRNPAGRSSSLLMLLVGMMMRMAMLSHSVQYWKLYETVASKNQILVLYIYWCVIFPGSPLLNLPDFVWSQYLVAWVMLCIYSLQTGCKRLYSTRVLVFCAMPWFDHLF